MEGDKTQDQLNGKQLATEFKCVHLESSGLKDSDIREVQRQAAQNYRKGESKLKSSFRGTNKRDPSAYIANKRYGGTGVD